MLSLCDDEGAVIVDDSEREETYRREAAFSIFTSVIRFELCHDEEVDSTKTSSLSHSPSHSCAALPAPRSPAFLRSCVTRSININTTNNICIKRYATRHGSNTPSRTSQIKPSHLPLALHMLSFGSFSTCVANNNSSALSCGCEMLFHQLPPQVFELLVFELPLASVLVLSTVSSQLRKAMRDEAVWVVLLRYVEFIFQ